MIDQLSSDYSTSAALVYERVIVPDMLPLICDKHGRLFLVDPGSPCDNSDIIGVNPGGSCGDIRVSDNIRGK